MTLGNTKLVDYGIHNEQSDLRAHVGVMAGKVYVYSTRKAVILLSQKTYRLRDVVNMKLKIVTAQGYAVPVQDIAPAIVDAADLIGQQMFAPLDDESVKGNKAVAVVQSLLRRGRFPLPANPLIVEDIDMQRSGLDVVVKGKWRIQVKCDYYCGNGVGCTGNLFLQVAECNPLGHK